MDKLLKLIKQYQSLTNAGIMLEGMRIILALDDEITRLNGNVKAGNNCCTLPESVSEMLFK